MKSIEVRVTRTREVTIEEFVDVTVNLADDETFKAETVADALIDAQIAAGQTIAWIPGAEKTKTYPAPRITAKQITPTEVQPAAPIPAVPVPLS